MKNEQVISKGVYGFSQIGNFISVKNYIFMHCEDKICLMIRFSNDTDFAFDSMAFWVIQLNAEGKTIGRTRVEYKDMSFMPGSLYTADKGVIVENQCVDFKIQFCEAYSGYYKYLVRNRRAVVYYDRKKAEQSLAANGGHTRTYLNAHKKEYGKAKLSVLAAIAALVLMLGFNIYYLYSLYADTLPENGGRNVCHEELEREETLCFGVEYAEI